MAKNVATISGIILAGGKSARMGTDKALLKVGPYYIIERISRVLSMMVDEIIIVTDRPERYAKYGDRTTFDIMPGNGPMGGIHAGLVEAAHPWVLVTACDLPFISTSVGRLMMQCADGYDVVVPRYRGYFEPLYALYNKNCIKVFEQHLTKGLIKITRLYEEFNTRYLEEEEMLQVEPHLERVFFNLNTPEDILKAQVWGNEPLKLQMD